MEIVSLHPIDDEVVHRYVASVQPELLARAASGSERATNQVTWGLAEQLARTSPSFVSRPFGLTFWEAQVDRSMGLSMRPPARLFGPAGLDRRVANRMPIRLEAQAGMMGGAWIPARLVPVVVQGFDAHLERSARRLLEAEIDPVLSIELMWSALEHAAKAQMGLFEAQDLMVLGAKAFGQPVIVPDQDRLPPEVLARIEPIITPPKKPGLLGRLFRRGEAELPTQKASHFSDVTIVESHEQ